MKHVCTPSCGNVRVNGRCITEWSQRATDHRELMLDLAEELDARTHNPRFPIDDEDHPCGLCEHFDWPYECRLYGEDAEPEGGCEAFVRAEGRRCDTCADWHVEGENSRHCFCIEEDTAADHSCEHWNTKDKG